MKTGEISRLNIFCAEPNSEDAYLISFHVPRQFPGVKLTLVPSGLELCAALEEAGGSEALPDIVVLSADLVDPPVESVLSCLKKRRRYADIPVLVTCEGTCAPGGRVPQYPAWTQVVVKDPRFWNLRQALAEVLTHQPDPTPELMAA